MHEQPDPSHADRRAFAVGYLSDRDVRLALLGNPRVNREQQYRELMAMIVRYGTKQRILGRLQAQAITTTRQNNEVVEAEREIYQRLKAVMGL